jgi:hypothetical protein
MPRHHANQLQSSELGLRDWWIRKAEMYITRRERNKIIPHISIR